VSGEAGLAVGLVELAVGVIFCHFLAQEPLLA
jgi:hypothetical protein